LEGGFARAGAWGRCRRSKQVISVTRARLLAPGFTRRVLPAGRVLSLAQVEGFGSCECRSISGCGPQQRPEITPISRWQTPSYGERKTSALSHACPDQPACCRARNRPDRTARQHITQRAAGSRSDTRVRLRTTHRTSRKRRDQYANCSNPKRNPRDLVHGEIFLFIVDTARAPNLSISLFQNAKLS
jgi:hypothetical protein